MANIKSSEKDIRKTAKRTKVNKAAQSRLKTLSKSVTDAVKSGDAKKFAEVAPKTASAYDKLAKTGVIHKNKANRVKSKLAKGAAKLKAAKPAA